MEGDLTAEQMATYREGARRRHDAEQAAVAAREERAWTIARMAASELRQQFGVHRVAVFGSLVHPLV